MQVAVHDHGFVLVKSMRMPGPIPIRYENQDSKDCSSSLMPFIFSSATEHLQQRQTGAERDVGFSCWPYLPAT